MKDKFVLTPVSIEQNEQQRIIESLKTTRTNIIDLSFPSGLEQIYGVEYRQLFAILADLLEEPPSGLDIKVTKKKDPLVVLSVK